MVDGVHLPNVAEQMLSVMTDAPTTQARRHVALSFWESCENRQRQREDGVGDGSQPDSG